MNLTARQVLDLAIAAGFDGQDAITATAIAFGESAGNPYAHNAKSPDDSYGLWQINMIGSLLQSRLRSFGLPNVEALYDPATNARVAFSLYNGRGRRFVDWGAFTNGSYARYLPSARTAWVSRQAEQPSPAVVPSNPIPGPSSIPAATGSTSQPEHSSATIPAVDSPLPVSQAGGFWPRLGLLLLSLFRGRESK